MPVNPYDDRKVSLRRPHGNGDLDIVRASYTRRKANVTEAAGEIAEPCLDMNIKVVAFTVSEKSINISLLFYKTFMVSQHRNRFQ